MMKSKKNIFNEPEDGKGHENTIKPDNDSPEEKVSGFNDKNNPVTDSQNEKKIEEPSDPKKTESELEKKVKEIETLTETMKRRQADFENYKKRMIKIQDEQKKLAIKDLALDIINLNDDLLRALDAACNISRQKSVDEICNTFSEGFAMISKRIEETLSKYDIVEIDSLNKVFDPNYNEAVEISESENVDYDTVTKVHQKGFRMNDYIIRAAKVKVTRPKKVSYNAGSADESKGLENGVSNSNSEEIL